jgi:hypothetical protein
VITKRDKPLAKPTPMRASPASRIGSLNGKLKIKGDILGTGVNWEVERFSRSKLIPLA